MTNYDTRIVTKAGSSSSDGLLLPGLDGANPLGFLAALGLFRTITRALGSQCVRIKWEPAAGTWVPRLAAPLSTQDELLDLLEHRLPSTSESHSSRLLSLLNTDDLTERRSLIEENVVTASAVERETADWVAAIASDFVPSSAINQLQTVRRDYFLGNLKSVILNTRREHLFRAIFHVWDYSDALENQSLHLDPAEDRRHAHQWNKPSGDPNRKRSGGMLGANRLAVEAFPLFVSLPESDSLHTLGFTGNRSDNTRWSWPLWQCAVDLQTMVSLLARPELQEQVPKKASRQVLTGLGIVAIWRTTRILVGKTPNFTPAQRIA